MKNLLLFLNKYEKVKENLRSENEKQVIIRLSSIKSKTKTKIKWKTAQNYWAFMPSKNFIFFFCM